MLQLKVYDGKQYIIMLQLVDMQFYGVQMLYPSSSLGAGTDREPSSLWSRMITKEANASARYLT